jgi:threonylcarbamoyladenosine tRNA methylthiotransferase MtaB
VRALVESGYREIVLTGVDVTSYGADLPGSPSLGSLVKRILKQVPAPPPAPVLDRQRRGRRAAVRTADRDEPRVMPHLHLSLQPATT